MTTIVNHAGLTVPDVFGAIDWYASVFGFRLIMGPRVLSVDSAPETRRIYGPGFVKGYHAHLLSDGGVGLEIFEFVEPPVDPPEEDSTPHAARPLPPLPHRR